MGRKTDYHHGDLANAVVHAALQKLAEQAHSDFSLSDLARSLGVTPAAVYKHFSDKAALLKAVVAAGFAQLAQAFEVAIPKGSKCKTKRQAVLHFERLAEAYYCFGLGSPALFQLMFGEAGAPYRVGVAADQGSSPSFSYLERAILDLYRLGAISKPVTPSHLWLAWCAIHGATQLALSKIATEIQPEQASKEVAQFILDAFN